MRSTVFALVLVLAACNSKTEAPPPDTASAEVNAIADAYLAATLNTYPFAAVYAGLGDVAGEDGAAMDDNSPEALAQFQNSEDHLAVRLRALDPKQLATRADTVLYHTLIEALEASLAQRVCRLHLWSVNHMSGWQNAFAQVAAVQKIGTPVERTKALERWRRLPAYLQQERANLDAGLAEGYSAPKRVVARVIAQLDSIVAAPPDDVPFLTFAASVENDPLFDDKIRVLASDIHLAIAEFRAYLKNDYMPKARDALSITAIPNGAECYEALLRTYHTADIGAEATYKRGTAAVAANREAVIEKGRAMFGEDDFGAILERVSVERTNRFGSEAELVAATRALAPVARQKIAPFFRTLPEQELIVEPFPDYQRGTGQSSRYEARPAADGAATYRIATDDWKTQTRGEAEITLVHEGWPGHHLQIATASSVKGLHPITQLLGSTAYIEGWARYSEALAEDAGIYESGYGAISRRSWPARGMVVDPGLHLYGWANERAKAFLIESGNFDDKTADEMLDRIAVIPGQLTAYDTGGLEIMALRTEAMERLGSRFDIRTFHERVLENGAVPLAVLRRHVEEWIASEEPK